jgi:hypothetical protein
MSYSQNPARNPFVSDSHKILFGEVMMHFGGQDFTVVPPSWLDSRVPLAPGSAAVPTRSTRLSCRPRLAAGALGDAFWHRSGPFIGFGRISLTIAW